MDSKKLSHFLQLAEQPQFRRHPPAKFVEEMGITGVSKRFKVAAWRLFRDERRWISCDEVSTYMEGRDAGGAHAEFKVGPIASHFLDSGSFTLWTEAEKYAKANNCSKWDFYHTPAFWDYISGYADFVREYKAGIDYYANVDVIPNPVLTYRNQMWLELECGLNPVPVVHYTTDLRWLKKYIDEGYEFIALGGLVGSMTKPACKAWVDRAFDVICDQPSKLPRVRIHGFGVTSHYMLWRYPWWSVDSTVWTKMGAFGEILVPPKRNGVWRFDLPPFKIGVSMDSITPGHYLLMSKTEKHIVDEWVEFIGMKMGSVGSNNHIEEYGIVTRHTDRRAANLHYFEKMRAAIPAYPWPWKSQKKRGMGFL